MLVEVSIEGSGAVGYGLATVANNGTVLDTWYAAPEIGVAPGPAGTVALTPEQAGSALGAASATCIRPDLRRAVDIVAVRTSIADLAEPPRDAHDVYLCLHLLSHRLVQPHGANLDGMFSLLANVAWTSLGPCLPEQIEAVRWEARAASLTLEVRSIDKLPRMTDFGESALELSNSGMRPLSHKLLRHADASGTRRRYFDTAKFVVAMALVELGSLERDGEQDRSCTSTRDCFLLGHIEHARSDTTTARLVWQIDEIDEQQPKRGTAQKAAKDFARRIPPQNDWQIATIDIPCLQAIVLRETVSNDGFHLRGQLGCNLQLGHIVLVAHAIFPRRSLTWKE